MQEGSDSDALIDGYVEMLDKLTTGLRSAHHAYHPVFTEFVLRLRIAVIINSRFRHRAKDALPNMNRTQAAISMHCRHPVTPGCDAMVSAAADCSVRRMVHALPCIVKGMTQQFFFYLSLVTLTFDL